MRLLLSDNREAGRLCCQVLLLMFLGLACACWPKRPARTEALMQFEAIAPGQYHFKDRRLAVTLTAGPGQVFRWRFENKKKQLLRIGSHQIAVTSQKKTKMYELWGGRFSQKATANEILVPLRGFLNLDYPVRFSSALFPFPPQDADALALVFEANWGEKQMKYRIAFPRPEAPN